MFGTLQVPVLTSYNSYNWSCTIYILMMDWSLVPLSIHYRVRECPEDFLLIRQFL